MLKQNESAKAVQTSLGRLLSAIPLTPNQWTLLSLIVAIIAAYEISQTNIILGLVFFGLAALFDVVDGAVARARNQVTKMGGFIDGITDRFVEALFLFSFMFYPMPTVLGVNPVIIISSLVFLGTCMPSFVRAYADHKGVIDHQTATSLGGICERSERLSIVIIGLGIGILYTNLVYFLYALILASALSLITIVQRLYKISKYSH